MIKRSLTVLFFLCIGFSTFFIIPGKTHADTVSEKLKRLKKDIARLESQQGQNEKERALVTKRLKYTELLISSLNVNLENILNHLAKTKARLTQINEEKQPLEKALQTQQALLSNQLQVSYNLGQYQYLKLILNQRDPTLTSRLLAYIGYINKARIDTLQTIFNINVRLTEKKELSEHNLNKLLQLQTSQRQKEAMLIKQKSTQKQLIARLSQQISARHEKINNYEKMAENLQRIVTKLNKNKQLKNRAFAKMRHQLPWPVNGQLVSHFGEEVKNNKIIENGVIFKAPEGRKIFAVHDGTVVFADWLKGFGLLLIMNHGQGYMTLYANNQALYHELGDNVRKGELIASIGHSGGQLEDGLYFEIRHNGRPLNPRHWLGVNKLTT